VCRGRLQTLAARGVTAALLIGALGGCSGRGTNTEAHDGQTIAEVNGQDITIHQLNYRLRGMLSGQPPADQPAAADAAARQLVDRELLVSRAIAAKRDRDPSVMLAIEETRRDILAAAYLEGVAAAAATPTAAELQDYYDKNPLKYAQRKVYLVRQILTDNSVTREQVEEVAKQAPTAEELVAWLHQRDAKILVTINTWSLDQLPNSLAERVQNLSKGHAIMMAAPMGLSINYLVDVRDAPETFDQAKDAIAKTLLDQRRKSLQDAELARLRSEATITWHGEFKDRGAAKPAAERAPPAAPADKPTDDKGLDAGIKGLR
jgi:EpsD family peptidyl-prolyl cis-trans isomerase